MTDRLQPGQGIMSFIVPQNDESEEEDQEHGGLDAEGELEEELEEGDYEDEEEIKDFEANDLPEGSGTDQHTQNEDGASADEDDSFEVQQSTPNNVRRVYSQLMPELIMQVRPLHRFYTPQLQKSVITNAPRTLASIGGPAVRFQRMPETPSAGVRRVPATPGSLGAPSRRIVRPVTVHTEQDETEDHPSTPVKREVNPAVLEEVCSCDGTTKRS